MTTSILNMSDEAMANFDPSTLVSEAATDTPTETPTDPVDDEVAPDADAETPDDKNVPAKADADEDDLDPENPDAGPDTTTPSDETKATAKREAKVEEGGEGKKPEDKPTDAPKSDAVVLDYEAEYKKLLKPFKANGREFQVSNVDDAVALMQMGVNYNKKMAALKPNLKLMKLLENNGLLDEGKLSFLIDLDKKNPDAINKLVKDSGIDPLDITADKASGYKPSTYTVDDREIELDTVLEDIRDTASYNRTLEIVSTKWDGASKQLIGKTPQLLTVINDHVERGIYDVIIKEVETERMFGRLNGLSDIEAYRQVGDAIQARGGFDHLGRQGNEAPKKPVVVEPPPKKVDDDKLRDKKRAASSTKPAAPGPKANDFNPLGMSDEEFSKQVNNKFL